MLVSNASTDVAVAGQTDMRADESCCRSSRQAATPSPCGAISERRGKGTVDVGVGQTIVVEAQLAVTNETISVEGAGRTLTSTLESQLATREIEALPLSGRNFLELALLVPGNQPAPTFNPTKTNSVLVSSAGQLGRSGNVMIDGQDNNDDVVGGPLLNLPIDAVAGVPDGDQPLRRGTRSHRLLGHQHRHARRCQLDAGLGFAVRPRWGLAGAPATLDANAVVPPFDRQQIGGAFGEPLRRDSIFWFGAGEFRNQDGAVLVGTRDTAARTIRRSFAPAPLDDGLWSMRVDAGTGSNRVTVRYAGERSTDTSPSSVDRAIGSATQRQDALNRYHALLGTWTSVRPRGLVNAFNASVSTFLNRTTPVAALPQYLPEHSGWRVVPHAAGDAPDPPAVLRHADACGGQHLLQAGGEFQRIAGEFDLGVFRQGRVEADRGFPAFDRSGTVASATTICCLRSRSGRQARPGPGAARLEQLAHCRLRAGRLVGIRIDSR